jgi:hypothetical protein
VKGICFVMILASTQCEERETPDAHLVLYSCIHVEFIRSSIDIIIVSSRGGTAAMGLPEVSRSPRLLDVDHFAFLSKCCERIVAASLIGWICWALVRFREKYLWPITEHHLILSHKMESQCPTPSMQIEMLSACQCYTSTSGC